MKSISFSAICYDHFPEKNKSVPGGNSLNFAVQIRRLGLSSAVAGFIGTDPAASQIEALCFREGIDTRLMFRIEGNTASNKLYNTDDGERYAREGDWQNGVKDDGWFDDKAWQYILTHDLIATTCNDQHLDELTRRKSTNNLVSVDFMHLYSGELLSKYLSKIDIAFLSPVAGIPWEIEDLSGIFQKPVVIMLGAEGSLTFFQGKKFVQKAYKVEKVTDTTGCGDAYHAGFCYALLNGGTIQDAMKLGTETATKVLKGVGGTF